MRYDDLIEDLVKWINNNLNEQLDLSTIAKRSGYSKGHLHRIFKEYRGVNIATFIRKERLKHALNDIVKSDCSILEIAINNGYNSHPAFSRTFYNTYGFPPKKIREPGVRKILIYALNAL